MLRMANPHMQNSRALSSLHAGVEWKDDLDANGNRVPPELSRARMTKMNSVIVSGTDPKMGTSTTLPRNSMFMTSAMAHDGAQFAPAGAQAGAEGEEEYIIKPHTMRRSVPQEGGPGDLTAGA